VGVIRVNQNTIYRTAPRAQKSAKAQLCTLRSKIGNLIHRRAAFLTVIWSHHRIQPVIWSQIQRLDRLNGSPGSRGGAWSFVARGFGAADRGLALDEFTAAVSFVHGTNRAQFDWANLISLVSAGPFEKEKLPKDAMGSLVNATTIGVDRVNFVRIGLTRSPTNNNDVGIQRDEIRFADTLRS